MISGVGGASSIDATTLNKMFSRLDTNQDGVVSQAEFDAGSPSPSAASKADQMFKAFDTDGDGQMTQSELATGFEKMSSAMKSVLLGSQDVSGSGASGSDSASSITQQLLDTLTSSDNSSKTGLDASTQQSLLSALLGLQENGSQAA
ncbi:EF-hand domain-containing protein [Hypericibacter sp.]|uniref:EF-hand domain-containing protein n=1 Tax=Hypericibacter sp. TaxID=2705401 RepID=UPI003D6CDB30